MLRTASFRIQDAMRELDEAIEYLDRYEFLDQANPNLKKSLEKRREDLDGHRLELWNVSVNS